MRMKNMLAQLREFAGVYRGQGTNHENEPFTGTLTLEPILEGMGFTIQFKATAPDGTAYQQEYSTIAPSMQNRLCLWNLNSNVPGVVVHELRRSESENGSLQSYIFGFGEPADETSFREEVTLELWRDGSLSYRYAWGMPGGAFKARSGVRMQPLKFGSDRPDCIKHYSEIQDDDTSAYPGSTELLSIGSAFSRKMGLKKIGVHHELLPPGRRTSWPHAESHEEEFAYVVEGHPHVWIDGHLHALRPGDGVAFPPGTGICHTFINNSDQNVRLIVVGETSKPENKCVYALHANRNEEIRKSGFLWEDVPPRELGPHDGLPDALRVR